MTLLNRIIAAVLALALLLGGALVAVEILLASLGRPPLVVPYQDWSAWLDAQRWDSTAVRGILAGMVLLGLLLVLVAARRGRPAVLTLSGGTDQAVHVTASRRGVERALAGAAEQVDGVDGATASAWRRRVTVTATAQGPGSSPDDEVSAAVRSRLDALGLVDSLRLRVRVLRREGR